MTTLMKSMAEEQTSLLGRLSEICSQDPVSFLSGVDAIAEAEEYIANDANPAE